MPHPRHIGFLIFLVIYAIFKYRAVPEMMGQATYIQTTAILVILTAVIPYLIAYFLTRNKSGTSGIVLSLLLPLILCVIGLATYFYLFIAPNAPGMSVTKVLPRAIVPGLVMGALLVMPRIMHRAG